MLQRIEAAHRFLQGRIRRTPVEPSPLLADRLGVPVWLKLECLQVTGSFKIRGAFFALAQLGEKARNGVATCSAGNHGKGLAYAARQLGLSATIFVPNSIDAAKHKAMKAMGAEVIRSPFPGFDATEVWALEEAARRGLPYLSAYDDEDVMAGNGGSVAKEVLEQVPDARTFVLPVGGGGHAGGFAIYAKHHRPDAQIVACQHEGCPALTLSLASGAAVTAMPPIETVAGGLEGGLGRKPFAALKERVDHAALASEQEIRQAVRWMLDHHQYLIEPSAAVVIAACLRDDFPTPQGPVVLFISGRNVSLDTLARCAFLR